MIWDPSICFKCLLSVFMAAVMLRTMEHVMVRGVFFWGLQQKADQIPVFLRSCSALTGN